MPSVRATRTRRAAARASLAVRAAAFWTAIALPGSIVVVLAVGGDPALVAALLAADAAALVVGHDYRAGRPNRDH